MITFAQATQLEQELDAFAVEDFFEATLCAAFLPADEDEPTYFALSTPDHEGGYFVDRARNINQWFIDACGRVPDALLVSPATKQAIIDSSWQRANPGALTQPANLRWTFFPLAEVGVPHGTALGVLNERSMVPGVVVIAHESVPENLIGHVVGIAPTGELDYHGYVLGGITVLTSPQVLRDAAA